MMGQGMMGTVERQPWSGKKEDPFVDPPSDMAGGFLAHSLLGAQRRYLSP